MRVSLQDDITDRQLENGATYCGRLTPVFERSLCDGDYIPPNDLLIPTPSGRHRHLDGSLFLKLDQACAQLIGLDRYIQLVIFLVVETGLRIEELCAVKWEDVSLDKRRMDLPKPPFKKPQAFAHCGSRPASVHLRTRRDWRKSK